MVDTKLSGLSAASAISGSDLFYVVQGSSSLKATGTQLKTWADTGNPIGANPTASVGLSAVNGSASTFMRSDGAPALDQTIAPTWTGMHTFAPSATGTPLTINSLAGSSLREPIFKGTVTDGGNSQFLVFNGTVTANTFTPTFGGIFAGSTFPSFNIGAYTIAANDTGVQPLISIYAVRTNSATDPVNGNITSVTTRPIVSVGSNSGDFFQITAGGNTLLAATSALGFNNAGLGAGSQDVFISRSAAATLQLGAANAASPVAQTLQAQGSRSGTDTNVAGANLTITSGQGTGNSTGSSLIFQTPAAVASGTGAQTQTTGLTLTNFSATLVPPLTISDTTQASNSVTGSIITAGGIGVAKAIFAAGNINGSNFTSAGAAGYSAANTAFFFWATRAALSSGADGSITFSNNAVTNSFTLTAPAATATPVIQLGAANAASPVAQTIQAQGSRSGTDSNVGGANLTVTSGQGTGTGTVSTLVFQSPVAVASGTGAQTQTTGLVVKVGTAVRTNYTVANLPAASTAGAGAMAFVTDGSTTVVLGLGLTVTGGGANKVPVYSDGTNWIIGG